MKVQKFFIDFFSILRSIWITGICIFRKKETTKYPNEPIKLHPRYRGKVVLTKDPDGKERCVACNLCATVCPVGCISLQKSENSDKKWYPEFFRINFSRCIFCGLCEEACPTFAIQLIPEFETSKFERKKLIYEKNDFMISNTGKYPNYNFYKVKKQKYKDIFKKNKSTKKVKSVDRKSILP